MDAPHRPDHVAALLLALERMPGAFEELDVPVAPDDHVQLAERGGIQEEPDVARVEPVEAAGDHHPLPAVRGVRRIAHRWEAGQLVGSDDAVVDAQGEASGAEVRIILGLRDGQRRAAACKLRQRGAWVPLHQGGGVDIAQRLREEEPLLLRKERCLAGRGPHQRVGPEVEVDAPQPRGLLEEPHVRGLQVVEAPRDDDPAGRLGQPAG